MIDRGDLPAFHVGRRVRIRRADLDEYMTSRPVKPKDVAPPRPSAAEQVARERVASASRSVAKATTRQDDAVLVAALLELSEASRALATALSKTAP